jgi:hypothetical protein
MEIATVRIAFVAALTLALAAACDGTPSTPYSRTPLVSEPPAPPVVAPPVAEDTVTGNWAGVVGYDYDGFAAYARLTHTGSSVVGSFYCDGSCLFSGTEIAGTVDGGAISARGNYPLGSCEFQGTISNDVTSIEGSYKCSRRLGSFFTLRKQVTIPEPVSCIPELLSPARGTLMDNGRTDGRDTIDWTIDWTDCPGATAYAIVVNGSAATIALIETITTESSFRHFSCGSYIAAQNASNWGLWLRAQVDGVWGPWSPVRNFDVERPDSDPLFNCSGSASPG